MCVFVFVFVCVCVCENVCVWTYLFSNPKGCEKNGKINHLVSLSNGHGKIKLYFLSTKKKKKVVKKNKMSSARI